MAAKRMFSIDVVDTDKFLDMPVSTQALYFHFGMRADDDGFVASPRKIVKIANCTNDDLKVLISKGYVIPFQSGVIVITDWKTNNFIRSDRYKATKYQEEFEQLELCNGACPKCKGSRRMSDKTGVPPEYCNADVSKFRFDTYKTSMEQTRKVFKNFIENFEKWQAWGKGLYLWSNTPGSGKTFLSCCLARSLMVKYDLQMRFITAPAYIDTVGESIKRARGEEDRSKVYKECDVLVLDDIGAQAGSKWQEQELFNLVNKRMEHGKITIYTSNMDANALNVDARTRDRIIKTSIVLQMPEENLRKKKAAAEQQSFLQMILQQQGR